ncbi:MAG: uracil-DNA glycosylase [Sphingomonadales bacterium]|nr:uracil-DNA glycosylase [Sphingomonadales bacterium]MDE2170079.1 uracil-DNA glycosylase [Sphingomonadales bacterium]
MPVLDDNLPPAWRPVLDPVLTTPEARRLSAFLDARAAEGVKIFPAAGQRFAALALVAPQDVKVVILGQDPYHGAGQAHGLAFSVERGGKVPPSLVNIYKELHADLGLPIPRHGDLHAWARQGVLLLNTALSVEEGHAGAHQNMGWEAITDAIIATVAASPQPCVFILWGSHAQKKAARIAGLRAPRHLVLEAPHPSPLSAHRGFFGSRPFSQTNAFLAAHGQAPIDWRLPES